MTFSEALDKLMLGHAIAREGWNGKNMYIYADGASGYEPYITMFTAAGKRQPGWLASQADIFANDWQVADEHAATKEG